GYYGDYVLTINGQTYNLSLRKGTTDYALALIGGSPVPEPSSLVLLVMSLGCSLRWRRSSPAAA
ncbi:MAG: PEP-CTERM sorting domain-containing protein, partial [Pirellulales bacterium]